MEKIEIYFEIDVRTVSKDVLIYENGNPIGHAGNPNVTRESPISIYPSPNNGVISLSKQNDLEYDLFIFPCEKDTMCSEVDFDNLVFEYSIDSLYNLDSNTLDVVTPDLQIQFYTGFKEGYYKLVFYTEGEGVIVENMYYDSSKSGNEMIEFF